MLGTKSLEKEPGAGGRGEESLCDCCQGEDIRSLFSQSATLCREDGAAVKFLLRSGQRK